jgi:hypothetical protein
VIPSTFLQQLQLITDWLNALVHLCSLASASVAKHFTERENAVAHLHSTRYFTICLNDESSLPYFKLAPSAASRARIKKVLHRDVLCWVTGQINDTVNSFSSYSHGPHGLLLPHCCMVNRYPANIPTWSCRYVLLSALSA